MKTYIFLLFCVFTLNKAENPKIIDGFIGGLDFETEEAVFKIYSDQTFSFQHWADAGCSRIIEDFGNWEKIKGNGYKLSSFQKIENMNCKKRKIFRSFKLIPKDSVAEVPSRIYGYRYLQQYSKRGLEILNKKTDNKN